ncbi:hypothetical protein MOV58_10550 [Staphylococcus hominis]|uniref:hypothetical protein n=1 Tax=Staphylococcus hominis TaxID=1290 RepID=UPI0010F38236|nr:hypothetical protein [Staphylococcus hominis]TBW91766.1 hypothetical protein EQ808_00395 [Staphylococcus hominis]UNQ67799.1 hypothetical protein MOV58_10550 [Staphylococcus hominis]
MNWLLFLKYIDGEYYIVQAGSNIVPTEEFDKVLPTTERIARQSDKVYFDGEKLKLKDGEILLSVEELNELKESPLEETKQTQSVIFDIE